jgi:hypothetical protein
MRVLISLSFLTAVGFLLVVLLSRSANMAGGLPASRALGAEPEPDVPKVHVSLPPPTGNRSPQTESRDEPSSSEGAPEEAPAPPSLSAADISALKSSFDALHFGSTKDQLREAYNSALERVPSDLISGLHKDKLAKGEFEILDVPVTKMENGGWATHFTSEVLKQNKPVLSLSHCLPDGRVVRTWLTPSDVAAFEQDILYLDWIVARLRGQN